MPTLILDNIFINYFGAYDVIHSFCHNFNSGLNVLYGAEGSGKTTLLKAIAGLVSIKEGKIVLNGEDIHDKHVKDRDIVMVFDDLALRKRRSARYNLELPLRLRKFDKEEIRAKIDAIAKEFGLSMSVLDSAVFRLSEEYRVRLALARAFIRESKILIFDNPLSKLSPDTQEELFLLLLGKIRQTDAIIIYATDSSREAESTLAETVILSYGYITDKGYPLAFRTMPQSLCTAEKFIKYSCSYNITLDDKGYFALLGASIPFDKNSLIGANYINKEVIAVIPPQAVVIGEGEDGTVTNIISVDNKRIAIIAAKSDTINAIVNDGVVIGDSIKYSINADKIFLFDINNEKSIIK